MQHPELPERVTRALDRARDAPIDREVAEELEREAEVQASLQRREREPLDVDPEVDRRLRRFLDR